MSIRDVDTELTELGKHQATCVAARLTSERLTHILVSPYQRTVATAREISRASNVPLTFFTGIHEHHGAKPENWAPKTRSELMFRYPEVAVPDDMPEVDWHRYPETPEEVKERMAAALSVLKRIFPQDARVALVSHASPIQQLIAAATTAYTAAEATRIVIGNASLTILDTSHDPHAVIGGMGQSEFITTDVPVLL